MKKIIIDKIKVIERSGGIFTGIVNIQRLLNEDVKSEDLNIAVVSFPMGVKNVFHKHDSDQLLWILSGRGIVATVDEEIIATPGMAFFIAAGEKHWHGATEDSSFSHISIIGKK